MNENILPSLNTFTPRDKNFRNEISLIIRSVLDSADPDRAVKKYLSLHDGIIKAGDQLINRYEYEKIYLVAIGKASIPMIQAAAFILGDDLYKGLAITKTAGSDEGIGRNISIIYGDHPIPGNHSIIAAEKILKFLSEVTQQDLIFFLISGGGSALITKPGSGLNLVDLQDTTRCLLNASVPIQAINTIRKHLDLVKGGGLLRSAQNARVLTFVLSDVVGNDLGVVASGPSMPDPTSYSDCLDIISKCHLERLIPDVVIDYLQSGMSGKIPETCKPGQNSNIHQEVLIGNIDLALDQVLELGTEFGYQVHRSTQYLAGDIETEYDRVFREFTEFIKTSGNGKYLMVWGGEVTVSRKGYGKGGRNMHMALLCAKSIAGLEGVTGIALATDGEDGSTDAAGAIVDGSTLERSSQLGLDYSKSLGEQSSYHFFQALGDLLITGSTGTNINDVFILIKN
jgi:hydroxypyruvate reductase